MTIYGRSVRGLACGLFDRGLGHEATAARFGRLSGPPLKAFSTFGQSIQRMQSRDCLSANKLPGQRRAPQSYTSHIVIEVPKS